MKELNIKYYLILFVFIIIGKTTFSQSDSLPYEVYKNKIVVYSDFGYTTAPFSIKFNHLDKYEKLKYRNNYNSILGFGVCYKWFALRIGIALPESNHNEDEFGKTTAYNLGFDFTVKKMFCDVDFRNYKGYIIKNSHKWDPNYNNVNSNLILPNVNSVSFSINAWYFHNKHFKMQAVRGKTAHFTRRVHTWYIKNTLNIYGVGNGSNNIIPSILYDSLNSKTKASAYSAFDFGLIPGYAFGNRINNWQFTGLLGFGGVIQNKFYTIDNYQRSFLGLAPRFDIRFIGGYSEPRYFVFIVTDFDNKSINYSNLKYNQTFYSIKLVGGIRFDNKEDKKKKRSRKD